MNIIAVDDERFALEGLLECIKKVVPDAIVFGFRTPEEALAHVKVRGCDVAFLDIKMRGMTGLTLAKCLKDICPKINVIFTTAYSEYIYDAMKNVRASGYLLKPITEADLKQELDNLRYPLPKSSDKRPFIQTFGNFDVFVDGEAVKFKRAKSKEILAYLVDRKGGMCDFKRIAAVIIEEDGNPIKQSNRISTYVKDLLSDLKAAGIGHIVRKEYGTISLVKEAVDCDYFRALAGDVSAINSYMGEYMYQYSWAEDTRTTRWNFEG
ncbi:MAG: response regulator [Candidatus Coproplasma sp.]